MAVAPLVPGVAAFALVYGVLARQAGLSLLATTMMSVLVFAGAAQFTAVSMWGPASGALIVVTTLMINLRHLLMGASMAPHLRGQSATWKALLAFGLVDESYALAISRYLRGEGSREFFLGVNVALYVAWVLSGLTGGVLGGLVMHPARWGIDLVFPLAFLGLLVPLLTRPVTGAVAAASGLVAVVAALLAPPLLAPEGAFGIGLSAAAAIPAAAVAWRTRQVFPTILAGVGSYWLLRWLVG